MVLTGLAVDELLNASSHFDLVLASHSEVLIQDIAERSGVMSAYVLQSQLIVIDLTVISGGSHMLKVGVEAFGQLRVESVKAHIASVLLEDLAANCCEIPVAKIVDDILIDLPRLHKEGVGNAEGVRSRLDPEVVNEPLEL